ncbi:MAG: ABC transporter substrate-binding protein [Anaerolineae bacterium]
MTAARVTRRRILSAVFALGAGGAILSACGSTPTPQVIKEVVTQVVEREVTKIVEGTPQVVKETVVVEQTSVVEKVVTVTAASAGPVNLIYSCYTFAAEAQQAIVDAWNTANPDTVLEMQLAPWDEYWMKIQTQIAGGQVPDIMQNSVAYVVALAYRNGFVDLDPLIERDGVDIAGFYPAAMNQWRWQYGSIQTGAGPLWSMPFTAQTSCMFFYNKTMFDSVGVAYPDDTWTWDTLIEKATQFTGGSGSDATYGITLDVSSYCTWWPRTWQAGGEFFDADMRTCTADGEASMTALTHVVDLFQTHKVAPLPGSYQISPFMTGKVAMASGGMWYITTYSDITDFEWDVAPSPKGPAGADTIDVISNGFSVMNGTAYVDQAWEVVKWLTMGEGGEAWCQTLNAGFANIAIAKKYTYTDTRDKTPVSLAQYSDLIGNGHIPYVAASWSEIDSTATTQLEAGIIGEKAADAAAADATANVNEILTAAWTKYAG